ncbi:MAG TPA: amidase family protein, partial [Thermomicrobiales bacterium]|nr:amidase family protein [Thermomicrobiales bacterium]
LGREPDLNEIEPATRRAWETGRRITAADYLLAVDDIQQFSRVLAQFLTGVDLWLTPTLGEPPIPVGTLSDTFTAYPAWVANVTGNPAMSVPLYWDADGLPIGVSFLARFGDEATLIRLASQLEAARPWAGRTPPIFAVEEQLSYDGRQPQTP